jgi:hypothetical protein
VSLAGQWERIQAGLPADWADARLSVRVADSADVSRAAALLAPLTPGISGRELRFVAARGGSGPSPLAVARGLALLDDAGVRSELSLVGSDEAAASMPAPSGRSLAAGWDALVETLPADWSDLYVEIELTSTDHLEPAALALAPVNPARHGVTACFRFRCARRFGYGASAGMVRRSLARLDERGIPGELRILRALSDTRPVGTQGPVWYVGGKVV